MKIAFSPSAGVPARSAESIFVIKMCEALATAGHQVTLLNPRTPDRTADVPDTYGHYGVERNFSIVDIPFPAMPVKRGYSSFRAVLRARRLGTEVVYTRALYTAVIAAGFGLPTVFEMHGPVGDEGSLDGRLLRRLIRSRRLLRIVVITHALKRHLQEQYGVPAARITVAPDAADVPAQSERIADLDSSRLHVGYVGHLYPGRGIELLVELAGRRSDIDFHCVGGLEADIAYWRAETEHLSNFHLHGYVPFAETQRFRASFDVLIAPYMKKVSIYGHDGDDTNTAAWMSPMKIFEYMASRKAIITSDLPAIREVLAHERDAVLCDPDDVAQWEAAIDRLQREPELRGSLAEAAYGEFLENYTWDAQVRKILSALDDTPGDS